MSANQVPTVLVIDDDPIFRAFLTTLLRSAGLDVREAEDGARGERVLAHHDVSLIVTDLVMPNKDGIEVVRELLDSASEIPIVVLSGWVIDEDCQYGKLVRLLGASASLSKFDAATTILPMIRALLPDWTPTDTSG